MIVFIVIGLVFVFVNKERINEIIESDCAEFDRDRAREKEFYASHPGVSRIPGLRSLAGFVNTEGWRSSVAFFLIILSSAILCHTTSGTLIYMKMSI